MDQQLLKLKKHRFMGLYNGTLISLPNQENGDVSKSIRRTYTKIIIIIDRIASMVLNIC